MGPSGLILEMLVPGLVVTTSTVVVASEIFDYDLAPDDGPSILLISGFLIISYLVGLALRHSSNFVFKFLDDGLVAQKRLNDMWKPLIPQLIQRYTASWPEELRPALVLVEDGWLDLDLESTRTLIGAIRDKSLAREGKGWSDYLMYQWNLARLARNNILPLSVAASLSAFSAIYSWIWGDGTNVMQYGIGAIVLAALAYRLVKVHEARIRMHVDILVRTSTGSEESKPP